MREISGHSLTELTSITTVCMGPPARLKPVNETRARACSDYDLIVLNATSRHRWRPPSGAGAERNAEPRRSGAKTEIYEPGSPRTRGAFRYFYVFFFVRDSRLRTDVRRAGAHRFTVYNF